MAGRYRDITPFFFLTLFIQDVLGYSAIRTGIAYLPFAVGVVVASALASPLVARIGPRPLILLGTAMIADGMFWFSRLTEHAGYASDLLGPQIVSSFGLGLVFVPLSLVSLHNVAEKDSGVASSLLNTGQQVGGAIGLAVLGTGSGRRWRRLDRTALLAGRIKFQRLRQSLCAPGTYQWMSTTVPMTTDWGAIAAMSLDAFPECLFDRVLTQRYRQAWRSRKPPV
jgi:MFS family permease